MAEERTGLEIAVIGMAGKFPGAANVYEFWENQVKGINSIARFTDEELKEAGIQENLLQDPNYIKAKGYIEGIEEFDSHFFGIKPSEAEKMDPQMRVFYECTLHALEHAGYNPWKYTGLIGLYAGATRCLEWELLSNFSGRVGPAERFGTVQLMNKDYLATGLSYKLNLKGPSITINTACSTSLVSIHLAVQALLSGECDIALAGGVSVTLPQKSGYYYQPGLIESTDGTCRAFDKDASGTVFGNGAGVVVLKALEEAISDGDTIHAIIKGSAINNDGTRKVGFTASSTKGQAEVIRAAYNAAEVDPETIGYVEAHGTGTELGDPIEIEALTLAFDTQKKQYCRIGSVKSSVGHLDSAAGVTGFIKTVLILKNKLIPASLNFEAPNPRIDFENTPFIVNAQLHSQENNGKPFRAAISSFGVGGTNAHVILEEAPPHPPHLDVNRDATNSTESFVGGQDQCRGEVSSPARSEDESRGEPLCSPSNEDILILVSAKTPNSLEKMTHNLAQYLRENPEANLADVAYTLQQGREEYEHRAMLVCDNPAEAVKHLTESATGQLQQYHVKTGEPSIYFLFPGQGSQYVDMAREMYQKILYFREEMDQCFRILQETGLMEKNLKEILFPRPPATTSINDTQIAQPLIFIIEYALARVLMKKGIQPKAMIGHSIGEYTAACISGVFTLKDALTLVALRGKYMQTVPEGDMLMVKLPEEQVKKLLIHHKELDLAAVNGPALSVVSGPAQAMKNFAQELEQKGSHSRMLHTSHAFHSKSMEPILEKFKQEVSKKIINAPQIPYYSNVTGKKITTEQVKEPQYWVTHLRHTVRFSDGLTEMLKEEEGVFVEVGPGRTLSTFLQQHPEKKTEHQVLNLLPHPQEEVSDYHYFLNKIGQLWLYGKEIDWTQRKPGTTPRRIPLPQYPFDKQRYWKLVEDYFNPENEGKFLVKTARKVTGVSDWFYRPLWKQSEPLPLEIENKSETSILWLIFMDNPGIYESIKQQLKGKVYHIKKGDQFKKETNTQYTIKPSVSGEIKKILKELQQPEEIKEIRVIYHWGLDNLKETEHHQNEEQLQQDEFYQLLRVVRELGGSEKNLPIHMVFLSEHQENVYGDERTEPHKRQLLAALKVIPYEYLHIRCSQIDISPQERQTTQYDKLTRFIIKELETGLPDPVIAFRNGKRWIQDYESVRIPETKTQPITTEKERVWLITGGLGIIGMAVAKGIATQGKTRIILVDNQEFPKEAQWQERQKTHEETEPHSQRIRQILEIKGNGTQVQVHQADYTDETRMEQIFKQARETIGPVTQVIHATEPTKEYQYTMIREQKEGNPGASLKTSIRELEVLGKQMSGSSIENMVVITSISPVLGGLGNLHQTVSDSLMETWINHYNKNENTPIQIKIINLDYWSLLKTGKGSITPEQTADALLRAIQWKDALHLVITLTDLKKRLLEGHLAESEEETAGTRAGEVKKAKERPHLPTPFVEPHTALEKQLALVAGNFFGFDRVGNHDNFFDLGASSLDLVQLSEKIAEKLQRDLQVVTLFRFPMISQLAKNMDQEETQTAESRKEQEKKKEVEIKKGRQSMQNRLQLIKQR